MLNRAVTAFRKGIHKRSKSNLSSDDESASSVVSTSSSIRNDSASSSLSIQKNDRRRRRGEGTFMQYYPHIGLFLSNHNYFDNTQCKHTDQWKHYSLDV